MKISLRESEAERVKEEDEGKSAGRRKKTEKSNRVYPMPGKRKEKEEEGKKVRTSEQKKKTENQEIPQPVWYIEKGGKT